MLFGRVFAVALRILKEKMKRLLIIGFMLMFTVSASAQELADSVSVYFHQGRSSWDPQFHDNEHRMEEFIKRVNEFKVDPKYNYIEVEYEAMASPEGPFSLNRRLAYERAQAVHNFLDGRINFAQEKGDGLHFTEDYTRLAEMVEASDMEYKEQILDIIEPIRGRVDVSEREATECKRKLQTLAGGKPWQYMYEHYFPYLRGFHVLVSLGVVPQEPIVKHDVVGAQMQYTPFIKPLNVGKFPVKDSWTRGLYLKTNAVGWLMFVSNVAIEVDICKHWSFNFPIYYSGIDYFSAELKLRMLGAYPEFRYWFKENDGLFVGAHLGVSLYNYALEGKWRIQDHGGETPAWGGGLNVGYRMPLSKKNPRWKVEFSLGAGVYDLHYDKFYNVDNGLRAERDIHKTKVMIDHVGVSFAYKFNLKSKKNR